LAYRLFYPLPFPVHLALLTAEAEELGVPVVTGRFGASMNVSLTNSGPVTILLDTERSF